MKDFFLYNLKFLFVFFFVWEISQFFWWERRKYSVILSALSIYLQSKVKYSYLSNP